MTKKHKKPEVNFCHCMDHAFAVVDEKLGDGLHVAMVSPEDSDLLAAYRWRAYCPHRKFSRDKRKLVFYLRRDSSNSQGGKRTILMHRAVTGAVGRTVIVDHENHNGLDCRRPNLRPGTHGQNRANGRIGRNNNSGFKGVSRHVRGRWKACAGAEKNGKGSRYIGLFDTPEEAARAYDRHAMIMWGDHALLNFPLEAAE